MPEPAVALVCDGLPPWHPAEGLDEDPLGVMGVGHRLHGPVFRMAVDGVETVMVGTWPGLRELVGAERGRLEVLNTPLVHALFGMALFNLTGEDHVEARRRLRPALSGRALPGYVAPLVDVAVPETGRWVGPGVADLFAAARELTHAMGARILLGIRPGEADAAEFAEQFERFVGATDVAPGRRRYAQARYWAGLRARRRLHELFNRRAAAGGAGSALPGLVAAFADAPVASGPLADHLLALLVAAQETTASLVTWALIELAAHREHAELAAAEARAAVAEPDLIVRSAALPVVRAVLAETQRRHSPNLLSLRTAVGPVELGGFRVPAGTRLAYCPSAGHFDPADFPQPHTFRPDRFLVQPGGAARLVAFGRGVHACLGRPVAELMAVTAVVAALHHGLPRLPAGPPGRVRYRPAKAPRDPLALVLDHGGAR